MDLILPSFPLGVNYMLRMLVKIFGSQQATAAVLRTMSPAEVADMYREEYYNPAKRKLNIALDLLDGWLDDPIVRQYIQGLMTDLLGHAVFVFRLERAERFV